MKVLRSIRKMKSHLGGLRERPVKIGLVPTMGFLHEGHLSLIRKAVSSCNSVIVSIFVNPIQFGPQEDFDRYPRDEERDLRLLKKEGIDAVFIPEAGEMYPDGFKSQVAVKELENRLCGALRPGHFRGVCTVVMKLFNIIRPDAAFFGQKDAQQAVILKKMVQDMNLDVKIEMMPIVRDPEGLALSSRNAYLDPQQRIRALSLSRGLQKAEKMVSHGERNSDKIICAVRNEIEPTFDTIDYVSAVNPDTLEDVSRISEGTLIAAAGRIGNIRLIDNIIIEIEESLP